MSLELLSKRMWSVCVHVCVYVCVHEHVCMGGERNTGEREKGTRETRKEGREGEKDGREIGEERTGEGREEEKGEMKGYEGQ